jgi:predicted RNase H-like HicB family nuclease
MKKNNKKAFELTVLIEQDEDGYYVGRVPALRSCYTQARTLETLHKRLKEVIELCLEEEKPAREKFVAVEQIEVKV